MENAYWVKGVSHGTGKTVIHRVDTLKEALFLKEQLSPPTEILPWGLGKLYRSEKEQNSLKT